MDETGQAYQKVTDLNYLSGLSKGDTQFVKEMIRIFLEENPREIRLLEEGIKERDFKRIYLAAHKLRSTMPFVGIDRLIEKEIAEIERIASDKSNVQKIEVSPEGNPDIKKIEIITTDKSQLYRIEELFPKVKDVCEKARVELGYQSPL
jgi:HPt (histidine-containing phosphotransfer) domain-containing protein